MVNGKFMNASRHVAQYFLYSRFRLICLLLLFKFWYNLIRKYIENDGLVSGPFS